MKISPDATQVTASSIGKWRRRRVSAPWGTPVKREYFWTFAALATLAQSLGCGGAYNATVSGKVTLAGQPLDRGTVTFVPDGSNAPGHGLIGSGGAYSINTGREEGLPSGSYTVTVVANAESTPNENPSLPPKPGKAITPQWYRESSTSPLKKTVEPGHNEIDLELTSDPPPGWKPPRGRR